MALKSKGRSKSKITTTSQDFEEYVTTPNNKAFVLFFFFTAFTSALFLVMKKSELISSAINPIKRKLISKYESSMVHINPQIKLYEQQCEYYSPETLGEFESVVNVMNMSVNKLKEDNLLFVMLNGENDGVFVQWNGENECIYEASKESAIDLGANTNWIQEGIRLYSQMGLPLKNAADVESNGRIVHILFDQQTWVWPGIRKGYTYNVDGVLMTTISLKPVVFSVDNFFTQEEADKIMEYGLPVLNRSRVDGVKKGQTVSKSRTSHTAFLPDNEFTRMFRVRSSKLARLPSPSFAERLQLVRYREGEFYRHHMDTFHSKNFLPQWSTKYRFQDYMTWADWASKRLLSLGGNTPPGFGIGEPYFPVSSDNGTFQRSLLQIFLNESSRTNFFDAFESKQMGEWIQHEVNLNASGLIQSIMGINASGHFLPHIIKAWERSVGLKSLRYQIPNRGVAGSSHYLRWIRWAKEEIHKLGDSAPLDIRPSGKWYPKYNQKFQSILVHFLLEDFTKQFLSQQLTKDWYDWIYTNKDRRDVLMEVLKNFPNFVELVIKSWERRTGINILNYRLPSYTKHFMPQRFVTLFLYLNDVPEGGETVFPYSPDQYITGINRTGMDECSSGLAVPAKGLRASLFYSQTGENEIDKWSRHGGCPPASGVKWGSNSFMWNADADEGANAWVR